MTFSDKPTGRASLVVHIDGHCIPFEHDAGLTPEEASALVSVAVSDHVARCTAPRSSTVIFNGKPACIG